MPHDAGEHPVVSMSITQNVTMDRGRPRSSNDCCRGPLGIRRLAGLVAGRLVSGRVVAGRVVAGRVVVALIVALGIAGAGLPVVWPATRPRVRSGRIADADIEHMLVERIFA